MLLRNYFILPFLMIVLLQISCAPKMINLTDSELIVVNRAIISKDKATNAVTLNNQLGDGLAILEEIDFTNGTIEIDLKGENTPGRSFVGVAFNIQNDSTYEAVYFRPFNFQSPEAIRRAHSIQYISHPTHNWRFLRTNYEGQYEAAYKRQPAPDNWFSVKLKVENESVYVYDQTSGKELLSVKRIVEPISQKIGLWMGNNSKGAFRNLRVK